MGACLGTHAEFKASEILNLDFVPPENHIQDFNETFEMATVLGKGHTSSVARMQNRDSSREYAVKQLSKSRKWSARNFVRESTILMKLSHNNIVGLCDVFIDKKNFYIVQELCSGGSLLDRVKNGHHFSDADGIEIAYQVLDALRFMHSHNIVHRDIKPDNIVFQSNRSDNRRNQIVLIDFGQAREVHDEEVFSDWFGTPAYMSPEMTRSRNGAELKKVDIWAVGVTTYVMLTAHLPFFGDDVKDLMKKVCQKVISFPASVPLTAAAKEFITALLGRDVDNRPSAVEAMDLDWIQSNPIPTSHEQHLKVWTDNLASFEDSSRMKQLVINMALEEMEEDDETMMQAAFDVIDVERDGSIEREQVVDYFVQQGMSPRRAEDRGSVLFGILAGEESKEVSPKAFARAHLTEQIGTDPDEIEKLFHRLDLDGDDKISVGDVRQLMVDLRCHSVDMDDAAEVLAEVDRNGCGFITMSEFQDAMRHLTVRSSRPFTVVSNDEDL